MLSAKAKQAIALVVDYMVGASSTPVGSFAVPAVFGLVVTALGFISGSGTDKKIEELKELGTGGFPNCDCFRVSGARSPTCQTSFIFPTVPRGSDGSIIFQETGSDIVNYGVNIADSPI